MNKTFVLFAVAAFIFVVFILLNILDIAIEEKNSNIAINSSSSSSIIFSSSVVSSLSQINPKFSSSIGSNSGRNIFNEVEITSKVNEIEICNLISCEKNKNFNFIKINYDSLAEKKVGDIFSVGVPGQVDVDVVVSDIKYSNGIKNLVGHLSGYPESYYFGLSVGENGDVYGEITTEKSNYAIRTYLGETVIYEVVPDVEKFKLNDY